MPYIKTFDRTQMMFCSWDSFVDEQSIARIIDAFVNSLDLQEFAVKEAATEADQHMIRKDCISFISMGIEKVSVLQESLQKVVR